MRAAVCKIGVVTVVAVVVAGCIRFGGPAVTTVDEAPVLACDVQDWELRGMTEGASGAPLHGIDEHLRRCPPADEASARADFERGHEVGRAAYCTPSQAYQLGRVGGTMRPVCPDEDRVRLQDAFLDGRSIYADYLKVRESERRLADIEQFSRVGAISAQDHRQFGVEPHPDIARLRDQWDALRARDDRLRARYDAPPLPFHSRALGR